MQTGEGGENAVATIAQHALWVVELEACSEGQIQQVLADIDWLTWLTTRLLMFLAHDDYNNHKSTKNASHEGVSDDESALSSSEMDDDGSDSDSDWEEQQEYHRKKRSGFSRGTKRKRNSSHVDAEHNIDTEDERCLLDNGDRIESDDSPSH